MQQISVGSQRVCVSVCVCVCVSVVFGRHFRFSFSLSLFDEMLLSFSPILVISIFESFSLVLV